jgi:hypothetical protein
MIALDTNILVYAHRADSPFQVKAESVLKTLVEKPDNWAIPYHCLIEFIAIITNPRIYKKPTPLEVAFEQLENITKCSNLFILPDFDRQLDLLKNISIRAKIRGPEIYDARIAASCIENGVSQLWSADRDYSRFAGLKVVNPLI